MAEQQGNDIVNELNTVVKGLLYPSETDAPLEPFFWPDESKGAPSAEVIAKHTQLPVNTLKNQSVATFFKPVVNEEDWHNEEEQAEVRRFQQVAATVKEVLKSPKVFRSGGVEKDVYVVGRVPGGYAGFKTKVVET